jgi:hypothetical protein
MSQNTLFRHNALLHVRSIIMYKCVMLFILNSLECSRFKSCLFILLVIEKAGNF